MVEALRQTLQQGGLVLLVILAASVVAWALILWQWLLLRERAAEGWERLDQTVDEIAQGRFQAASEPGSERGELVQRIRWLTQRYRAHDRASFEAQVMPLLRAQTLTLDRPLGMIATLATAMPLLGLLGTVLGMTQTFSALTDRGQAPIDALAGGVSQALITTQAGLVMAVPVVLMHGILTSRVRRWTSAATTAIKRLESAVCRD